VHTVTAWIPVTVTTHVPVTVTVPVTSQETVTGYSTVIVSAVDTVYESSTLPPTTVIVETSYTLPPYQTTYMMSSADSSSADYTSVYGSSETPCETDTIYSTVTTTEYGMYSMYSSMATTMATVTTTAAAGGADSSSADSSSYSSAYSSADSSSSSSFSAPSGWPYTYPAGSSNGTVTTSGPPPIATAGASRFGPAVALVVAGVLGAAVLI
jgi:hypothetical protein